MTYVIQFVTFYELWAFVVHFLGFMTTPQTASQYK